MRTQARTPEQCQAICSVDPKCLAVDYATTRGAYNDERPGIYRTGACILNGGFNIPANLIIKSYEKSAVSGAAQCLFAIAESQPRFETQALSGVILNLCMSGTVPGGYPEYPDPLSGGFLAFERCQIQFDRGTRTSTVTSSGTARLRRPQVRPNAGPCGLASTQSVPKSNAR